MLYVFEWLGYQEVSLPMMRENPVAYAQFQDPRTYMARTAMIMLVAAMILSLHVERSRFGRSLLAIKQNEPAAEAAGIDAPRQKMYAIMLSAAIAAAAGGLYANVLLVVTPQTMFGMLVSAQALIVSLFGGVGVFWGPVIGAAVLVPLAEILHGELGHIVPGIQGVVYGLAIIVIILLAPEGIYWKLRDRFAPVRPPPAVPRVAAAPAVAAAQTGADAKPVLTLDRVRQAVRRASRAVNDVTFSIDERSLTFIVGPNGAGKTTLFNLITGVVHPDEGRIRFRGGRTSPASARIALPVWASAARSRSSSRFAA